MRAIAGKIRAFYLRDCCWPYSLSFYLALAVYALDFGPADQPGHYPSLAAWAILAAYWLRNLYLYSRGRLATGDPVFFIRFLTLKIAAWGLLLGGLLLAA